MFSTPVLADGLPLKSEWQQSPHIYWILHSVLAKLINVVVWMVSTGPLISSSSSPFIKLLEIIPSGPITTDIIITLMFQSF